MIVEDSQCQLPYVCAYVLTHKMTYILNPLTKTQQKESKVNILLSHGTLKGKG